MKKYLLLVCIIIVFGFSLLSGGTKYAYAGCFIMFFAFLAILIKNIYEYNMSRRQSLDNYINLKRDNLVNTILLLVLLLLNTYRDVLSIKNTENFVLIVALYMALGIRLLIAILCIPKIFPAGFICSNGEVISFDKIKSIKSKSGMFMSYKQLTVEYKNKSEIFKAHFLDYENVKKYIQTYGSIVIEEID